MRKTSLSVLASCLLTTAWADPSFYIEAATRGNAGAQYNLGRCYTDGNKGVDKDVAKGIEWITKAAEQGHIDAQCTLGMYYEIGVGVDKDAAKSFEWYKKAAEQGSTHAQSFVVGYYRTGTGVEQDDDKAAEWAKKSAEQRKADAQARKEELIGDMIVDPSKYAAAAEQGDAEALYNLALCYAFAEGSGREARDKSMELIRQAAEQGYAKAQYALGLHCGMNRNENEGVEWIKKSAEQGFAEAQYIMGMAHEFGEGVDKDLAKAIGWYEKAAVQGNTKARDKLIELSRQPPAVIGQGMNTVQKINTGAVQPLVQGGTSPSQVKGGGAEKDGAVPPPSRLWLYATIALCVLLGGIAIAWPYCRKGR